LVIILPKSNLIFNVSKDLPERLPVVSEKPKIAVKEGVEERVGEKKLGGGKIQITNFKFATVIGKNPFIYAAK